MNQTNSDGSGSGYSCRPISALLHPHSKSHKEPHGISSTKKTARLQKRAVDGTAPRKPSPATSFPNFARLPAEIRLMIWEEFTCLPRTLLLHAPEKWTIEDTNGRPPNWQSPSRNPALLAVNVEAREVALRRYTVALPLMSSERVLYVQPDRDMVVVQEPGPTHRLTYLLDWFAKKDPEKVGLRRLGMGVYSWWLVNNPRAWPNPQPTMPRTLLPSLMASIEEFVVFPNTRSPRNGAMCVLHDSSRTFAQRQVRSFVKGLVRRLDTDTERLFRDGDEWTTVGKNPLKVLFLRCYSNKSGW